MKNYRTCLGIAGATLLPTVAVAGLLQLNVFTAGSPISSGAVNDNFSALNQRLSDLEQTVGSLMAQQNLPTVVEATSDTAQDGLEDRDLPYDYATLELSAGTWLVHAFGTLVTIDEPDQIQLGLCYVNGTDCPVVEGSMSAMGSAAGNPKAGIALTTVKVITVPAQPQPQTMIVKMIGINNGASILRFSGTGDGLRLTQRQRLLAVRLR